MNRRATALTPAMRSVAIIEAATLWPWIVDVRWSRAEDIGQHTIKVVQAPMHARPMGEDHIPDDAQLLRAEVFVATRFDEFSQHERMVHKAHYRAYLMWRKAWALRKSVDELVCWTDFDPVLIDENVERWCKPGVRYTGD